MTRIGLALLAAVAALLAAGAERARAATTFVVTNTNGSGPGSLAQAILDSNANPGNDTIAFAIPGAGVHVIAPSQSLSVLSDPVVLDGTTQPGYAGQPLIELNGLGGGSTGLIVHGDSVVRGLDLVGWFEAIRLTGTGNDVVSANVIGADPTATFAMPNRIGLDVQSDRNTIGGTTAADRNVISGNANVGIELTAHPMRNVVEGNFVGTDGTGRQAIPNLIGIELVTQAFDNVIGTSPGGGNVISGNSEIGIFVSNCELPGGIGGGSCPQPQFHPSRTVIRNNMIGVDVTGNARLGNGGDGIDVWTADRTTIGGPTVLSANVISANGGDGIWLKDADRSLVAANVIGTNAAGTVPFGNGHHGVDLLRATRTLVGRADLGNAFVGAPNLISGNGGDGVHVEDSSGDDVLGNLVGTNRAGTFAFGNAGNGVAIVAQTAPAQHNHVGEPGNGNLISGNAQAGVAILGNDVGQTADANVVSANAIGTNGSGTVALSNGIGVRILNGLGNEVGGASGEGNLIAGNLAGGVAIDGVGGSNGVDFNAIGVQVGNGGPGVRLSSDSNRVASNAISLNGGAGVEVAGGQGNRITANSMAANAGLGIDLDPLGVTPNDPGDADAGPNGLQNFPALGPVTQQGNQVKVAGTLNSRPLRTYVLDFYANASCDPSGFGEGQLLLGSTTVTTDAAGNASFNVTLTSPIPNARMTATAADQAGGSTSEFSACVLAG